MAKNLEEAAIWAEFKQYQDTEYIGRYEHYQRLLYSKCGFQELEKRDPSVGYYAKSPYLNVYAMPEELDYLGDVLESLPENIVRADEFIRSSPKEKDDSWKVVMKKALNYNQSTDKLIYFSLGELFPCHLKKSKNYF